MKALNRILGALAVSLALASGAVAQAILPNAMTQFVDANGIPVANGWVYFYIPTTNTPKNTWQDIGETILNTNPVHLDSAGRALIWGTGSYREVVTDSLNNVVWDQVTSAPGSGGGGTATINGFGAQTSITSAGTTDLGSITTNNALITGTNTITSFGSSATLATPLFEVQFTGALTISYNAVSMILPGAQNFVTHAGDTAMMLYLGGGNWQMVDYSYAVATSLPGSVTTQGGVVPRVVASGTTTGNQTPTANTADQYDMLGLTGAITVLTPSGASTNGQKLILHFKDNGTIRNITWTVVAGAFRAVGITLPTATVAGKNLYVGCIRNTGDNFWDCLATAEE